MPMRRESTHVWHRRLYGGQLEKVTLLKRDDDQAEGTVRALIVYQMRRKMIFRAGEPLQGDITSTHHISWVFPKVELRRLGVAYISAIDRIVDSFGRTWQPESTTRIDQDVGEFHRRGLSEG